MQRYQKNSHMGQISLKIGSLAPDTRQNHISSLLVKWWRVYSTQGWEAWQDDSAFLCEHCWVRSEPQKRLYREPPINIIIVPTTTICMRFSWAWAPQREQKHLWGGKERPHFPQHSSIHTTRAFHVTGTVIEPGLQMWIDKVSIFLDQVCILVVGREARINKRINWSHS